MGKLESESIPQSTVDSSKRPASCKGDRPNHFTMENGDEYDLSGLDRDLYAKAVHDLLDKPEDECVIVYKDLYKGKAAPLSSSPPFRFPDIFCPEEYDITLGSKEIAIAGDDYKSGDKTVRYQIGILVNKEQSEEERSSEINWRPSVVVNPQYHTAHLKVNTDEPQEEVY